MNQLKPRYSEILEIIQVSGGFIVREKSDGRVPRSSSNLYKVDSCFRFLWEIPVKISGDGFPNPLVVGDVSITAYSGNGVEICFDPSTGNILSEKLVRF